MDSSQSDSTETVIKQFPNTTYLGEGGEVRAAGNLIMTDRRLLFLRQVNLSQKQAQEIQELAKESTTSELIQHSLKLHKKNFQLPLSSIVTAKMGLLSIIPIRPCLRVQYLSASKKIRTLTFVFTLPLLKRLMLNEFPTISWMQTIRKAIKAERKKGTPTY